MPRLSVYVGQQPQESNAAAGRVGEAGAGPASCAAAAPAASLSPPQQEQAAQQHGMEQQYAAAAIKLQADYAKRLREHGQRTFRWPDGSLRPECPPPQPHTVVS